VGSSLANSDKLPTIRLFIVYRFIGERYGENVAIRIILGATKMIFRYSLQAHRFYRNLDASYMAKMAFPKETSRNWIYFMFQISLDFLFVFILQDYFPTLYSMSMTNRTSPDRSENPFLNLEI
jgi:hypothetical protein